jgi:hypothetical protein
MAADQFMNIDRQVHGIHGIHGIHSLQPLFSFFAETSR